MRKRMSDFDEARKTAKTYNELNKDELLIVIIDLIKEMALLNPQNDKEKWDNAYWKLDWAIVVRRAIGSLML